MSAATNPRPPCPSTSLKHIVAALSACTIVLAAGEVHYVYFDRRNLPDIGRFTRFEFSTAGHIYDAGDRPLIELARERREISRYEDIPPIVRDAILAAEDKRFFSHNGIDYLSLPRVLGRVRLGMLVWRLVRGGRHDEIRGSDLFPQGGSTITQQLCVAISSAASQRGTTAMSYDQPGSRHGVLSSVIGARSRQRAGPEARGNTALVLARAGDVGPGFGSKRRAKEEILARYAGGRRCSAGRPSDSE